MEYNPFSLFGKKILITGASSGIGKTTAIECSKLGATIILTARNKERLKETLSLLDGENHQYVVSDLSKETDIENLVQQIPLIDGVVNNAGLNVTQLVPFIKSDSLDNIVQTNLKAPILLTHLLIKKKKINKGGTIVFTSSIASKGFCSVGNSLYSATKGGLSAFMRNIAYELASKKIRCNAVLPGLIETPLKDGKSMITDEQFQKNMELYPLKRYGNPTDVAWGIIYLLSDASIWVTGTELVIDGGRSLK